MGLSGRQACLCSKVREKRIALDLPQSALTPSIGFFEQIDGIVFLAAIGVRAGNPRGKRLRFRGINKTCA
jgi:hypothetical protein